MNRLRIGQILAVLLLIGLAANWRLALWVFRVQDRLGLVIGAAWLVLVILTVAGLASGLRWAAFTLFVLAVFSTAALSIPLFPGMHIVGLRGPIALAAWNFVPLLAGVIFLRIRDVSRSPG